jgi:hypothetical protein
LTDWSKDLQVRHKLILLSLYDLGLSWNILKAIDRDRVLGIGMDCTCIEIRRGPDITHLSGPAWQPTQPSVKWVTGDLPGVKRQGCGGNNYPHLALRLLFCVYMAGYRGRLTSVLSYFMRRPTSMTGTSWTSWLDLMKLDY